DSRFNVPQAIRRSFHDEKPPAGARPIKITGIKGAPGAMTAHVTDDGRVFLPKPADPRARAIWRDIDTSTALHPKALQRLVEESKSGAPGATIAIDKIVDPALPEVLRTLDKADSPKAFAELVAKQSNMSVPLVRDIVRDQADFYLAQGRGVEAQRLYDHVEALAGAPAADLHLRKGLASLEVGRLREGQAALKRALDGTISDAETDILRRFISSRGDDLDDVRAVLNRRLNGLVPGAPQAPPNASLGLDHGRIVTRAPFDRAAAQPMKSSDMKKLVEALEP